MDLGRIARSVAPPHLALFVGAVVIAAALVMGEADPAQAAARDATRADSVAGVDDFAFSSMDVDYVLGRDDAGRSTLHTVEHLVAQFPDVDQNRGIRRAIPETYDGHSTELRIISVSDETGAPRAYTTSVDGDFLVLTIAVPPGQYVHGEQHYVIEYSQRDVTKYFTDTDDDEFYWDVNGTGWPQAFGTVTATVTLDSDLGSLVEEASCYRGPEGSTMPCETQFDGAVLTISESSLEPYENVTVVLAFPTGTFAAAPFSLFTIVPWPAVLGLGAGVLAGVFALLARLILMRDARGRGTTVAQYEPPEGIPIPVAAEILGRTTKSFAALIIDQAVHGRLRIVERRGRRNKPEFGILPLSAETPPDPWAGRMLDAIFFRPEIPTTRSPWTIFGSTDPAQAPDGVQWFRKNDSFLGRHVQAMTKRARDHALTAGLRRKPPRWPTTVVVALSAIAMASLIALVVFDSSEAAIVAGVLGLNLIPWLAIIAVSLVVSKRPLTSAGAEVREHLDGLRLFIGWAEADRLRMLQSVSGAERIPLDPTPGSADATRVVAIYERLLPFAVLFGQEKEWAVELSNYYATETPNWYSGSSPGFNAGLFAASIGSFASNTASSYSGSSSSSSSGGSGGGGSSGGGGGGGGGGGV